MFGFVFVSHCLLSYGGILEVTAWMVSRIAGRCRCDKVVRVQRGGNLLRTDGGGYYHHFGPNAVCPWPSGTPLTCERQHSPAKGNPRKIDR